MPEVYKEHFFAQLLFRHCEAIIEEKWLSQAAANKVMELLSGRPRPEVEKASRQILPILDSIHTEELYLKSVEEILEKL